jgi:hypothetical protein
MCITDVCYYNVSLVLMMFINVSKKIIMFLKYLCDVTKGLLHMVSEQVQPYDIGPLRHPLC